MEEIDIALITKRSIHGVFALVTRTFFIQIVGFIVNFLLTIFLAPSVFGIYFIVTAVINFLSYFSDIGLAAALIQKKEAITNDDLATTFTIQQTLVISATVIALSLSLWVGKFYHLDIGGIYLFQALVFAFFLSSLKTIPSILLERDLRFDKLVIPQIVETLFFNIIALIFAMKGFGVTSFTYAVLARGIAGLVAMYIVSPWRPRLGISKPIAKRLLSFGIPFQANSFLALLKDDLLIAYVGKILPLTQVGYIGFAQKWAFMPLRLIMDNIIRITFPSFSRLQHEAAHLGKAIEKSLFALALFTFPALMGLIVLAPHFIVIIPKYHKWEPAVLSLGLFAINAALSSISTPLTNALNAIGKIKTSLYLMIFWTISTWILTPIFIHLMGFNGFAFVSALVATSVVGVVYITKKYIQFHAFAPTFGPAVATICIGLVLWFVGNALPTNIMTILLLIILGIGIYFGLMFVFAKREMLTDLALLRQQFIKK